MQAAEMTEKCCFLFLVTLTFDLWPWSVDLQTCPNKGPNTSSMWMCPISIQRFPRYLPKTPFFVCGDLGLWPLTLTFKLVGAWDQIRLPCEFGANPFSGSWDITDIFYLFHKFHENPPITFWLILLTNKQTNSSKNSTPPNVVEIMVGMTVNKRWQKIPHTSCCRDAKWHLLTKIKGNIADIFGQLWTWVQWGFGRLFRRRQLRPGQRQREDHQDLNNIINSHHYWRTSYCFTGAQQQQNEEMPGLSQISSVIPRDICRKRRFLSLVTLTFDLW